MKKLYVLALLAIATPAFGQTQNGPTKLSQLPLVPAPITGTEIFPCDQAVGGIMTGAYGCTISSLVPYLQTQGLGGGSSGVSSFNTRTGAVVLSGADVTNALGFSLGSAAQQNTGTSGSNLTFANGANTWNAKQTFQGPTSAPFTAVYNLPRFTKTGTYTINSAESDYEICGDTTSASVTINTPTSPAPVNGDHYLVTDCNGHAATNNITISAGAGQTINFNHAATMVINTNGGGVGLTWDSTNSNWDAH